MDRLSPLDASFLHVEDATQPMHIASVATFEGPAPGYDELLATIAGKLPLVPRYRQKVRFVPLQLGRPVWVDDSHFNLEYHIRHTALPSPGTDAQLRNLVGRVMSQQLDRTKPLWELWIAEGLEGGRWSLLLKVHHCMVDGVSGSELLAVLYDTEPAGAPGASAPEAPSEAPPEVRWAPGDEPTEIALVGETVRTLVSSPYEQFRALRSFVLQGPQPARDLLRDVARGIRRASEVVRPAPATSINGPIGPHRRWDWATASLADLKGVAKSSGSTVNDVLLATVTSGFRDLLIERGEEVRDGAIRAFVPVSVRGAGEHHEYNNKVSGMIASLPVGIDDPLERLDAISDQMSDLKESKEAVAGEMLTQLGGFAPPMLNALGARVAYKSPQRVLNTVVTNVPGPQIPLYVCGRKMLSAYPYVPLAANVRITVGIFSYDGGVYYGVTGDYESCPDVHVLCRGIEREVRELVDLFA